MDYSVQAYLERRSTTELLRFLEWNMCQDRWQQYEQTAPLIFAVLQKRGVVLPERIRISWDAFHCEKNQ